MRAAVVGGGIAGLAAAWELCDRAEVTVFEPGRLGGRIITEPFEGRPVDCGPDAFLVRSPAAVELCAELGVDDLVAPAAGRALIWWNGRLEPVPEGTVFGAPTRLRPLLGSRLISPLGALRAAADLVLPARRPTGDLSVRRLIAGRYGAEVADRLVDPLVGSIHAGRSEDLSAEATVPQLFAAASSGRSLIKALGGAARRSAAGGEGGPPGPVFLAPREGLQALVDALVSRLCDRGTAFEARRVDRVRAAGDVVEVDGGRFDAGILAVGAREAARLLGEAAPTGLGCEPAASVALVTMGFRHIDLPPGVSGLLVPRPEGHLMTACSFASEKWPHWAGPDRTLMRVSAGRFGDHRIDTLGDEDLIERLAAELSRALGEPAAAAPETWRVSRWPDAFPQYMVGHVRLVASVGESMTATMPRVALCGSSYNGIGIPACVASGREAAKKVCVAAR